MKDYNTPEIEEIHLSAEDLMIDVNTSIDVDDSHAKGDMGTWDDEDWVNDNE